MSSNADSNSVPEPPPEESPVDGLNSSGGRLLGTISRRYFEPSTWNLSAPEPKSKYDTFFILMIGRIRNKESSIIEVRKFVELLATNEDYWAPVPYIIPELEVGYPAASEAHNEQFVLLYTLLKMGLEEQKRYGTKPEAKRIGAQTGLPQVQQEILASTLFGRETVAANRTDKQNQFLKSHLEMGYPVDVMAKHREAAAQSGRPLQDDDIGLPTNIGVPILPQPQQTGGPVQRSGKDGSKMGTSDRQPALTSMMPPQPLPKGQRPRERSHSRSGWAERILQKQRERQPNLAPDFSPEAPRDPIVQKGFPSRNRAALHPQPPILDDVVRHPGEEPMLTPQYAKRPGENLVHGHYLQRKSSLDLKAGAKDALKENVSASMENRAQAAWHAGSLSQTQGAETTQNTPDLRSTDSLDEYCLNKSSKEGDSLDEYCLNKPSKDGDSLDEYCLNKSSSDRPEPASHAAPQGVPAQAEQIGSSSDLAPLTVPQSRSSSLLTQLLAPLHNAPRTPQTSETTQHPQQRRSTVGSDSRPQSLKQHSPSPPDIFGDLQGSLRGGGSKRTSEEVRRAEKDMEKRMKTWLEDNPMERLP